MSHYEDLCRERSALLDLDMAEGLTHEECSRLNAIEIELDEIEFAQLRGTYIDD